MNSKIRRDDENKASIISRILDKFFYVKTKDFERIFDKERQVLGIDTIFSLNDKRYICDEKAAIRYANRNLRTFSFELSFIDRSGHIKDGWLLDKNKVNDSFMLIWIDKAKKSDFTSEDDILELEIALISKDRIIRYLDMCGLSSSVLTNVKNDILDKKLNSIYVENFKFICSKQLAEKPINVLINRHDLIKISDFNCKIYMH